jgi:GNAT superfamily N-acetyltransferase
MKRSLRSVLRRSVHLLARRALALVPRPWRFALFRAMVDCPLDPGPGLQLKIADTREELEACFALLHDAYVGEGFMAPDPSGLRVTDYHALPTTTTLCAKVDGRVVGTLSLIREGLFGFPMQTAFDLGSVRAKAGRIAEVSALAVHRDYRGTGGRILFPLMKFMYEYCTTYFDTRHLVIAVNPNKIEMYEALLMFQRLPAAPVERYAFANGAPAVGATLDLSSAPEAMRAVYAGRPARRNLLAYFVECRLPNLVTPLRRYHTTNDPVMTESLIEYFFVRRTQVYTAMDPRRQLLLRSMYALGPLPTAEASAARQAHGTRRAHPRYSISFPACWRPIGGGPELRLRLTDLSLSGFRAEGDRPLPTGQRGWLAVELGDGLWSAVDATVVHRTGADGATVSHGFRIGAPDAAWRSCVDALHLGRTHADLAPSRLPAGAAAAAEPAWS